MDMKPDVDRIAEEAVGARLGSGPPDEVRQRAGMAPEDIARRAARSAGPQASTAVKTAESVGERLGDAYSDAASDGAQKRMWNVGGPAGTRAGSGAGGAANPVVAAGRQAAQILSHQFDEPLMMMV